MRAGFDLPDWNSLASLEGDTLPLLGTALLIARDEYPQLDANLYDTLLQSHAEHLRGEIEAIDAWPMKMQAINRHLFEELGYKGNHDEYYDPRNSYLNEVFERRLGNPVSLAMVQMEVARRLGVPLDGVSFPGHFLVRLPIDDGVLVMDPFNRGRPLDEDELRQRARPHLGALQRPGRRAGHHRRPAARDQRSRGGLVHDRCRVARARTGARGLRLLRARPGRGAAVRVDRRPGGHVGASSDD